MGHRWQKWETCLKENKKKHDQDYKLLIILKKSLRNRPEECVCAGARALHISVFIDMNEYVHAVFTYFVASVSTISGLFAHIKAWVYNQPEINI